MPSQIENQGKPDEKLCAFIIECVMAISKIQSKTSNQQQGDILSEISKKVYGQTMNSYKISEFIKNTGTGSTKRQNSDDTQERANEFDDRNTSKKKKKNK